ncbi:hypothetical protein F5141DRAFT_1060119 [Pisolithus sp. B1]|nr:hypothetical protein F5141DRAFT_1060119 [Pisolithus sp. B1]
MVLEEICAFVKNVKMTAKELGQWHGWSACDILVTMGFGVKSSHTKLNNANLFHLWYWATQPKPDGADRNAINNLITKEYNSLMKDVPKDDLAVRRERLKAVYDWSENSSAVPTNRSVKSIAVRVANVKTQFSGLAEAWSNLEDIEIVGAAMYVGQDPAGHQTSGIFGGSEVIRDFINEKAIDIQGLMDKYTAIFKCLRNGDGMEARLISTSSAGDATTALELHCHIKETLRDHNCRVFGSMMKEKLLAALRDICITQGIEVSDPQKVAWNQLLELMQKYHLTIINWPHSVSPPGPGFDHKKLKAGPLRQLIVPYLWRKLGHMYDRQTDDEEEQDSLDDVPEIKIKCWNQDIINILDVSPLKGDIPLVKTADGTILQKVSDDPEWQKSRQEEDHQWQSTEQPRMEVSNDDDTVPQYLLTFTRFCSLATMRHHVMKARIPALLYGIPVTAHLQFQAAPTLKSLAHPTSLHWLHDTRILGMTMQTIMNLVHLIFLTMHYHLPTTTTSHQFIKGILTFLLTLTLISTMMPAALQWVNRGSTTPQYEDDFNGDYIDNYF